jgi:uncharacterized protein YacL
MKNAISFARTLYTLLSILFMTTFVAGTNPDKALTLTTFLTGGILGLTFSFFLFGFDFLCRKFSLRTFNVTLLGLFFGYLMGEATVALYQAVLELSNLHLAAPIERLIRVSLFLFSTYTGVIMTIRSSEELSLSIPFLRLTPRTEKKRDIIVDTSILQDVRIIDLANSGLLDHHLIVPRFVVRALNSDLDGNDDTKKSRAKRALDTLKKLESISSLHLRYDDTDFHDAKDPMDRVTKLARLLDTNILTADINRMQQSSYEGVRIINIHALANALKPVTQAGEFLEVKIQRYGKEARQGIGYLDDGTMVVVNGGGDFIGKTIKGQVLSVKHTASGRMVFCNANDIELTSSTGQFDNSSAKMELAGSRT